MDQQNNRKRRKNNSNLPLFTYLIDKSYETLCKNLFQKWAAYQPTFCSCFGWEEKQCSFERKSNVQFSSCWVVMLRHGMRNIVSSNWLDIGTWLLTEWIFQHYSHWVATFILKQLLAELMSKHHSQPRGYTDLPLLDALHVLDVYVYFGAQ